jgi:hypothetical protein
MMLSEDLILSKIYIIRNEKVMLDRDLAELYGVETKYLKRQVRRNSLRFPIDFMFELTDKELKIWRSQFGTSNEDKMGLRYAPFAFTEDGVAQLSTVLSSEVAIKVNVQIIRMFSRLRKVALAHSEIFLKLERIEKLGLKHDKQIELIFEYLKQFEKARKEEIEFENRPRIGFRPTKSNSDNHVPKECK